MSAKDNTVFSVAIQFGRNFSTLCPEAVIYGYAKLLLMDEMQVRNLITSDTDRQDMERARKWFEENKLDLGLIRSGLFLLSPLLKKMENWETETKEFAAFVEAGSGSTLSEQLLEKACEHMVIPVKDIFAKGHVMDDIFAYQKLLQEKQHAGESQAEDTPTAKQFEEKKEKESSGNPEVESDEKRDFFSLSEKYRNLSTALLDVVKGQERAVLKFVQGHYQGELLKRTEKNKSPRSYFFFFGPPGVGKTLLAETAAEVLGVPHMTFDMSEYSGFSSTDILIGTSQIYKNSTEGILVKFVRENPECVLIFDEIEKAHINVIRLFLQILGSGKAHNVSRNTDTSFRDATIIFTSNVGRELYADRSIDLTALPEKVLVDAIQKEKNDYGEPALPPELCSRIASGNTVMFNHLSIRYLVQMVNDNFNRIAVGMEKEYGCSVTYSNILPLLFLYNRGGEIDARVAMGQSGKFIKDELYELTRQLDNCQSKEQKISSIHLDVEWDGMDTELKHLFVNDEKTEVLFLMGEGTDALDKMDNNKYLVHRATSLEEARRYLKNDIAAVFIDPFFGKREENESILSIADYNTDGVRFFHELAESPTNLPIYLVGNNEKFSEVDRRTFSQEGASGTILLTDGQTESFLRQFDQIMEELYMEREHQLFSQRGWVIDFYTKQDVSESDGHVKILFYGLKKRMAVDVESRGSVLSEAERPNVLFQDIVGAENAKEELQYFIRYLKNPKQFLLTGGKPPKGVLLYGPPGTGKTMLAKAMAGESDVAFLQTSASEFKNMYLGESEANIRKLFRKARKYAPAIIFIDEIDAIGKKRTGSEFTAASESILNALLTEMDGFSSEGNQKPIFVLAATNYGVGAESDGIASLDEALIRRFDNKIYVDLPKQEERKEYLSRLVSAKNMKDVTEHALNNLAERTTGQSLAVLQNVIDLAYRNAVKANRLVKDDDLFDALEEYMYGEKRERTPEYYRSVAIHETGHAYVSYISGDKPSYITIESRGNFGGYMQHANSEDIPSYTREDLLAKIRIALAGRAAEQVFYGKDKALNTGASSDLEQATNYAFRMICTYGMEEDQLVVFSQKEIMESSVAGDYINRVNEILKQEMKNTISLLEEGKETVQRIAEELAKENRLTGEQFAELMENGQDRE